MLTVTSEFIKKKLFGDAVNITKTSALLEFIQLSHLFGIYAIALQRRTNNHQPQ